MHKRGLLSLDRCRQSNLAEKSVGIAETDKRSETLCVCCAKGITLEDGNEGQDLSNRTKNRQK